MERKKVIHSFIQSFVGRFIQQQRGIVVCAIVVFFLLCFAATLAALRLSWQYNCCFGQKEITQPQNVADYMAGL